MKILCITNQEADYLADAFIIGCKLVFETNVHEFSVKKILYKSTDIGEVRGFGFSLYNILPVSISKSFENLNPVDLENFDLIVFTSIYRQYDQFLNFLPYLKSSNTILLDGEDKGNVFMYAGRYWKNPKNWFRPKPHKYFTYFKREITDLTNFSLYYKLIPKLITRRLPLHRNLKTVSFAIPKEKIISSLTEKNKIFPKHIVDEEVSSAVPGSSVRYAFNNEEEYYKDLQQSKYGITTKRGGWDCLRHYEIAANGAVICFKNLDLKPALCAPHGLIPNVNCISYRNYTDLIRQIENISEEEYKKMQTNSMQWIRENTCEKLVQNVISKVFEKTINK